MIQISNKVIRPNACIEGKDIQDLEQEYNFKFPEDIKQFYLLWTRYRKYKESSIKERGSDVQRKNSNAY